VCLTLGLIAASAKVMLRYFRLISHARLLRLEPLVRPPQTYNVEVRAIAAPILTDIPLLWYVLPD